MDLRKSKKIKENKIEESKLAFENLPEFFGLRTPIIHKPIKYKKEREQEPDAMPDIRFGTRIVVPNFDSDGYWIEGHLIGYLLGRIIDIKENKIEFWNHDIVIYFIVEATSHWKLDDHIGRIRHMSSHSYDIKNGVSTKFRIGTENMPRRIEKG